MKKYVVITIEANVLVFDYRSINSEEKSFVNNRPVLGRRINFESKELKGMRFHKDDKPLINVIKRRKPTKLK